MRYPRTIPRQLASSLQGKSATRIPCLVFGRTRPGATDTNGIIRSLVITSDSGLAPGSTPPQGDNIGTTTQAAGAPTTANDSTVAATQDEAENATEATTTDIPILTMDPAVKEFIAKMESITPTTVKDDNMVQRVLTESLDLLHQQDTAHNALALTQSMQHLLELWISMHFQAATSPKTNRPFSILIEAWGCIAPDPQAPNEAMHVLQRWYELLGGDIELSPDVQDFNQVLGVYATTCAHAAPSWQQQELQQHCTITIPTATPTEVCSLASSAYDFVQEIRATWGYNAKSKQWMETNGHVVKCMSSAIRSMAPITQDNMDATEVAWYQLQKTMSESVQPMINDYYPTTKDKPQSFFTTSKTKQVEPQDLYVLQQTYGDALLASRTVLMAHTKGLDMKKHTEQTHNLPLWHSWGQTLKETLMDQPERLASVLEFAASQQGDDKSGMPSSFDHLSNACEAWQYCLANHGLDMVDPVTLAEMHQAMLETLQALGQAFASTDRQRLEVHRSLLNHYLLGIQQWENIKEMTGETEPIPQQEGLLQQLQEQHWQLVEPFASDKLQQGLQIEADASISKEEQERYTQQVRQTLTASFNCVMSALYTVGQVDEAISLFQAMKPFGVPHDTISQSTVLKSLADSKDLQAANLATRYFRDSRTKWLTGKRGAIQPDGTHYASVLVAWSRSANDKASQRALQVLNWLLKDLRNTGSNNPEIQLGSIHFSTLFTTLARHRGREDWWAFAIVDKSKLMIASLEPAKKDAMAVGAALNALKQVATTEATEIAQHLFDELCVQYSNTEMESYRPTAFHYGCMMHTWARAATTGQVGTEAQARIEQLLAQLEDDYEATKDPALFPNAIVYQALMNSITAVPNALDAGERADHVLQMMQQKAAQGLAEPPGEHMYNRCIEAHRNAKGEWGGERAEGVLDKMKHAFYEQGMAEAKPRLYAYRAVLQAWALCGQTDKATRARRILQELQDLYDKGDLEMKPDYFSYVEVIKCCAHTPISAGNEMRQEAVRIALQTLVEMEEQFVEIRSSFAYSLLLFTLQRHASGRERDQVASALFEKCAKKGIVDEHLVRYLRDCSPHLYEKLPKSLPPKWSENLGTAKKGED